MPDWQIALVSSLSVLVAIPVLFFASLFLSNVWQARQDARVWDGPKCVRCGRSVEHAEKRYPDCPSAVAAAPFRTRAATAVLRRVRK